MNTQTTQAQSAQQQEQSEFERLLSKPVIVIPQADKPKVVIPQVDKAKVNWQRHFQLFRERMAYWLRSDRGRCSDLARHLNVSRQTVWRWFFNGWSSFPGWAAVACNVYYYERQPREADRELKARQKGRGLHAHALWLELPSLRVRTPRRTKFVAGSEDKPEPEESEEW